MTSEDMDYLFLKCPVNILLAISNGYSFRSSISRKINVTFCCCCNSIKVLKNLGMVNERKDGRKINIVLTEKGAKIVENIKSIKNCR